jgi:glutathione S-transferase
MSIKLHRCSAIFVKGPHPCWTAQEALDEAGVEYELVKHHPLRWFRGDVKQMTGQQKVPLIEFEDGTFLRDSKVIAARAREGTLHGPGETAPFSS